MDLRCVLVQPNCLYTSLYTFVCDFVVPKLLRTVLIASHTITPASNWLSHRYSILMQSLPKLNQALTKLPHSKYLPQNRTIDIYGNFESKL